MTLPKDLQIYCRNRILKRVILCIILISVFATILALWGSVIFNTDNKAFQTSCYVVVLPDTNDRSVHCSVCGSSNDIENDQCRDCGHSLIKHI